MIKKILNMMKVFLDGCYEDHMQFSKDLEDALFEFYDVMEEENSEVTRFLNEDLPDICASYDEEKEEVFRRSIEEQYKAALQMYSK